MQIVRGQNMPLSRENRGEPAEGSLNLSCKHREPTYALSQAVAPLGELPL